MVRLEMMLANLTGDWPWLLIVVLVVFGGSQLPKLAKNAGEAMKEFRKAHNEVTDAPSAAPTSAPALYPPPAAGAVPGVVTASTPSAAPVAPGAATAPSGEELVTLTRSELDRILAAKAGQDGTPPSSAPSN